MRIGAAYTRCRVNRLFNAGSLIKIKDKAFGASNPGGPMEDTGRAAGVWAGCRRARVSSREVPYCRCPCPSLTLSALDMYPVAHERNDLAVFAPMTGGSRAPFW